MKNAGIGQRIKSKDGIIGVVEKVNENSVIIKILENPTEVPYDNMVTVINHKNYKILQKN